MTEPKESTTKTALLVLGMHRSGTSLLSGLIAQAGVDLGQHIMAAAPDNPKGFWENQRIVDLNEKILNYLGLSWSSWEPLPDGWHRQAGLQSLRNQLAQILDDEFGDSDIFCIKDPRLCRLMPLWLEVCADKGIALRCALINRPVSEVVASLQARDSLGRAHAEALWLRYNLDMIAGIAGIEGVSTGYGALLEDPADALQAISMLLGRSLSVSDTAFADPKLKHHSHGDDGPAWARELVQSLHSYPVQASPLYESAIYPLVAELAAQEREQATSLVEPSELQADKLQSARENLLFDQAQEARIYASSLEQELETARVYVTDMQRELEIRGKYALSMEQELSTARAYIADMERELEKRQSYAHSLRDALTEKESELARVLENHAEDVARREEYTQSLIRELDKVRSELENTRAELAAELQRFRHLRRISDYLNSRSDSDE